MMEESKFELLRVRDILNILVGNEDFGLLEINGVESEVSVSMPYLSGPVLCDISKKFGLSVSYGDGGTLSRWQYLDNLIEHCIKNNQESNLLAYLFAKERFAGKLMELPLDFIDQAHAQIVSAVIKGINAVLYFGGHELVEVDGVFCVRKIGSAVTVSTPSFKNIDKAYVTKKYYEALKAIKDESYDSAITKSRTLLEEVFIYVIRIKGETPDDKGNAYSLYAQVKKLYNMTQKGDQDHRVNGLLSGLEKILSAIVEMRNKAGDAHGVGDKRINIKDYHARLFVNSAATMADFILSVSENASHQSNKSQ